MAGVLDILNMTNPIPVREMLPKEGFGAERHVTDMAMRLGLASPAVGIGGLNPLNTDPSWDMLPWWSNVNDLVADLPTDSMEQRAELKKYCQALYAGDNDALRAIDLGGVSQSVLHLATLGVKKIQAKERMRTFDDLHRAMRSDLQKAKTGEGSRGGHVIGRTASGRAVYGPNSFHYHPLRKKKSDKKRVLAMNQHLQYTAQDHKDAQQIHSAAAKKENDPQKKAAHEKAAQAHALAPEKGAVTLTSH